MAVRALNVNRRQCRSLAAWLLACCLLCGASVGAIGGTTWQVYSPEGPSWRERPETTTREVLPPVALEVPSVVGGTDQGTRVVDAVVVAESVSGHPTPGPLSEDVMALTADARGALWVATLSGLSRFDGQDWVSFTRADGLADDQFYAMTTGRSGDAWACGDSGVTHFDGKRWTHYPGIRGCGSIAAAADGTVWATGERMSAYRFDGTDWWRYEAGGGMFRSWDRYPWCLTVDQSGVVWIGFRFMEFRGGPTYNLASFDGNRWVCYALSEPNIVEDVFGIYVDAADRVLVAYPEGLAVLDQGGWHSYSSADPVFASIGVMTGDGVGRLWMSNSIGMGYLQDGRWTGTPGPQSAFFAADNASIDGRGDLWLSGPHVPGVLRWRSADLPTSVRGGPGFPGPPPGERLELSPNPFNQQAEVRFALPRAASIELQVFDLAGQLVATLAQGSYPAGVHTVVWDAATRGRDLASGVYLCRLTGAGQPVVRKLSLLR